MKQKDTNHPGRPFPIGQPVLFFRAAAWHRNGRVSPAFVAGGFPLPAYHSGAVVVAGHHTAFHPVAALAEADAAVQPDGVGGGVAALVGPSGPGCPMVAVVRLEPGAVTDRYAFSSACTMQAVRGQGLASSEDGDVRLEPGVALEGEARDFFRLEAFDAGLELLVYLAETPEDASGLEAWTKSVVLPQPPKRQARKGKQAEPEAEAA